MCCVGGETQVKGMASGRHVSAEAWLQSEERHRVGLNGFGQGESVTSHCL